MQGLTLDQIWDIPSGTVELTIRTTVPPSGRFFDDVSVVVSEIEGLVLNEQDRAQLPTEER